MKLQHTSLALVALLAAGFLASATLAQTAAPDASSPAAEPEAPALADIDLPPPPTGGMPIFDAMAARASARDFPGELTAEQLSAIFWAASGINRPAEAKLTTPTAMNQQEIIPYAVTANGTYRYEPTSHRLVACRAGDFRAQLGMQPFAPGAALIVVFVLDKTRLRGWGSPDFEAMQARFLSMAYADMGFQAQDVYLAAAANFLPSRYVASIDPALAATALQLPSSSTVLGAQLVGAPPAP